MSNSYEIIIKENFMLFLLLLISSGGIYAAAKVYTEQKEIAELNEEKKEEVIETEKDSVTKQTAESDIKEGVSENQKGD